MLDKNCDALKFGLRIKDELFRVKIVPSETSGNFLLSVNNQQYEIVKDGTIWKSIEEVELNPAILDIAGDRINFYINHLYEPIQ